MLSDLTTISLCVCKQVPKGSAYLVDPVQCLAGHVVFLCVGFLQALPSFPYYYPKLILTERYLYIRY